MNPKGILIPFIENVLSDMLWNNRDTELGLKISWQKIIMIFERHKVLKEQEICSHLESSILQMFITGWHVPGTVHTPALYSSTDSYQLYSPG